MLPSFFKKKSIEWATPNDPPYESHRVNLYIHDSKAVQTLGPFTIANVTDVTATYPVRILPVYGTSLQDELQFLAINLYSWSEGAATELSITVDLHALNAPPQVWTEFSLPQSIPTNERLGPSCRPRDSNKKLFIAGVVSAAFGITVIAFWIIQRWRQWRAKVHGADKIPPATALVGEEERETIERSKGLQALIQHDNEP